MSERIRASAVSAPGAGSRVLSYLGSLRRFFLNSGFRWRVLTRAIYKGEHFQGETTSFEDRYPDLFRLCKARLEPLPSPRILCFGCSTGEEAFTLARYLPRAEIVGVDINPWCLKQSRLRNSNPRIRFLHRNANEFNRIDGFDAIFCLAVFQRTEHRTEKLTPLETGFTFDRFESEIRFLERKLKPGGVFFLDESDYAFELTEIARNYTPLDFPVNKILRERPVFDREGRRVAERSEFTRAFLKRNLL